MKQSDGGDFICAVFSLSSASLFGQRCENISTGRERKTAKSSGSTRGSARLLNSIELAFITSWRSVIWNCAVADSSLSHSFFSFVALCKYLRSVTERTRQNQLQAFTKLARSISLQHAHTHTVRCFAVTYIFFSSPSPIDFEWKIAWHTVPFQIDGFDWMQRQPLSFTSQSAGQKGKTTLHTKIRFRQLLLFKKFATWTPSKLWHSIELIESTQINYNPSI